MAQAGARTIKISIESGSQRVLSDIMHRNFDLMSADKIVKECHRRNLSVEGVFIVGLIGEKKQEILETFAFAEKLKLDNAVFYAATPFPGTSFYDMAVKRGYVSATSYFRDAFITDTSILRIPRSSPDFALAPQALSSLIKKQGGRVA
jgi:radical SAM superfamily enzyme YgiQ (UPF0313 family)